MATKNESQDYVLPEASAGLNLRLGEKDFTVYEKARIIGVRAAMIASGAGTMVDPGDLINPVDIARKELAENKCPLMIRRPIPSRNHKKPNYEYRRVSDLQKAV